MTLGCSEALSHCIAALAAPGSGMFKLDSYAAYASQYDSYMHHMQPYFVSQCFTPRSMSLSTMLFKSSSPHCQVYRDLVQARLQCNRFCVTLEELRDLFHDFLDTGLQSVGLIPI